MKDSVSFQLVWQCENGHDADTVEVDELSEVGEYAYTHADDCHELTHNECFGWVELDRIEIVEGATVTESRSVPEL